MKIAYLNPRSAMGGAEVALLNIIAAISRAQPDWEIVLIAPEDGPLLARARVFGAACKAIPFPNSVARLGDSGAGGPAGKQVSRVNLFGRVLLSAPAIAVATFRLRSAFRSIDPDVIHTNGFKMHVLGALAKPARTPLIWHIHDYVSPRPLMARLIRLLRHRCALILANSESVKQDIERVCGKIFKVQTLYNAVDTKVFSPEGERLDLDSLSGLAVNGSRNSFVRIGLLATFARWKGHQVFLRALSLLPADIRWRAYIVGDAVYQTDGSQFSRAELQSLAQQLGISDRVGFTGFVEQPAAALRALDIVVHASTQPEPFGLTIVEAMACGRPVIVSHAGGAAELIEPRLMKPNGNGTPAASTARPTQIALSHTPGNAEELAARITQLARDEQLRAQISSAAKSAVTECFNSSRLTDELIALYRHAATAA
jgi:glycosyltransferase involved in cell wall biosynthesis